MKIKLSAGTNYKVKSRNYRME